MSLSVGIVGLPNAGKSTLFNALTRAHAAVGAFPFTTIDPNTGVVAVPDDRLRQLAEVFHPPKVIPATVTFTDIAGLVRGAHLGEGLGNQFLGHVRGADAIAFVLRAFTASEVGHVEGDVDPLRDLEILELELALADLATVDRRLDRVGKVTRAGAATRQAQAEVSGLQKVREALDQGTPARLVSLNKEEQVGVADAQLLTAKPVIFIANVDETEVGANPVTGLAVAIAERAASEGADFAVVSAKLEAELSELDPAEAEEFLLGLGLTEAGLGRLSRAGYHSLRLLTFFTAGEKEVKAWTVAQGANARDAAGVIHTDFAKGFIRAEVCDWEELVAAGSYAAVRERGQRRLEGRDYLVQDGDVMHFLFNV
ncbi:MAG TPA: redox-regulated ATPase YchF [Candidatus Saccharimonadales bacterium]|nr:redox-regulated ATPase YchF [Candidatus Saccharimonadales bacterium]